MEVRRKWVLQLEHGIGTCARGGQLLAVGAPVRRRGSDGVGVIVSGACSGWRVAVGSSVMPLQADHLEVAPGSPAEQFAAGALAAAMLHDPRKQRNLRLQLTSAAAVVL